MPTLEPIDMGGPPTLGIVGDDNLITVKRTLPVCMGRTHQIVVNPDERTVTCERCKRMFDPIDALLELARYPDRWRDWVTHLEGAVKRAEERLASLKKQINNARAMLRRRGVAPEEP